MSEQKKDRMAVSLAEMQSRKKVLRRHIRQCILDIQSGDAQDIPTILTELESNLAVARLGGVTQCEVLTRTDIASATESITAILISKPNDVQSAVVGLLRGKKIETEIVEGM